MTELLLAERVDLQHEPRTDVTGGTALDRACLVAEYMSYMEVAGFSTRPQAIWDRKRGARCFLARFPDPEAWLSLPVEEQLCYPKRERSFLHYLFLRRLLPMPAGYILVSRTRLGEMGRRLMERATYERYYDMAARLGYSKADIERQFQLLLYLMSWARKPADSLTLGDYDGFVADLKHAWNELNGQWLLAATRNGLPAARNGPLPAVRNVLYHLGIFPQVTKKGSSEIGFERLWQRIPSGIKDTMRRYLRQLAVSLCPGTVNVERGRLFHFCSWLTMTMAEVTSISQVKRRHIEAFKEHLRWAPPQRQRRAPGTTLDSSTRYEIIAALHRFFLRIAEWQWPESPERMPIFEQDLPLRKYALPRFLEDAEAARFLEVARNHPDLFTRVCGVTLLLTGLRRSEFLALTTDCIVHIGDGDWLRVPIGKTRRDRFVPLHAEVKQILDEWIAAHPPEKPYDFLFTKHGRRIGGGAVERAVKGIARKASIPGSVTPHRLRHTLATLAINRGMPLESIAALLGHQSLCMTLVYARIGNRTVQQEYSAVSQQLEQLCNRAQALAETEIPALPPAAEGSQMRKLRQEHWRMLGNGYCARPDGMPCEYETICETCPCFSTTVEFLPVLSRQRDDAQNKGQVQRAQIFSQLIDRVQERA